jgi:hypothetical protein
MAQNKIRMTLRSNGTIMIVEGEKVILAGEKVILEGKRMVIDSDGIIVEAEKLTKITSGNLEIEIETVPD